MILRIVVATAALVCTLAAETRTKNIVIVTADGLRWQELFGGLDATLPLKPAKPELAKATSEERRSALMPYFWGQLAKRGVILGNVNRNSSVKVSNGYRVSYPGYSEILTGRSQDDKVRGNDKIQNPSQTILEFLREKWNLPQRKVALFGSWDTFRWIAESKPGSVFINSGYEKADGSPRMQELSSLQSGAPTPWDSVRHDYVTLNMALDYMKREKPRVTYIALGETDDWAHDKRYDRTLWAIQYLDQALSQIFAFIDNTSAYKGKTAVIVTTDHGRGGTPEDWNGHGSKVAGADQIWIAMFGPDIPARGEMTDSAPAEQRDIAPTILTLLGIDPAEYKGVTGKPIRISESDLGSGAGQPSRPESR